MDGFHQAQGGVEGFHEYSDEYLDSTKGREFSGFQSGW